MVNPIGLLGGVVGAAIPLGAAALGIGKNKTNVTDFGRTSQYDPNRFQYGGNELGADKAASRYANLGRQAQTRAAAQAEVTGADYGAANAWDAQGLAARGQAGQAAGLMMGRATGAVPSIASLQAQQDMQRAAAAQSSAGASARGAAGLALAQQGAANNTATMQAAISNQAQVNAANERMMAERSAFDAYSGMRAGDSIAAQNAAQRAQFDAANINDVSKYNAGLIAQQRGMNDAFQLGMTQNEMGVRNAQLNAGLAEQGLLGQTMMQGQAQRIGVGQANADRQMTYYNQFGNAVTGALGGQGMMGGGGGGGAPQPNTGLGASPTGMGAAGGAQSSSVGVPVPSDDAMKFGMTPLSLLGIGGGGGAASGPSSGPARASYDVVSNGGMDVMGSLKAHNDAAMKYQNDPTGGMQGGGLLSDDKAKLRAAYLQGRADEGTDAEPAERAYVAGHSADVGSVFANSLSAGAPFVGPLPGMATAATSLYDRADQLMARRAAARESEDRMRERETAAAREQGDADFAEWARAAGGDGVRRYPGAPADPVTQQFAAGLAPIRYEYKPGMGPPGQQTGVRAQQAETQPLTASMVTRRPDGLRQIDPAMGLGTALAGVGHLAQKQAATEGLLSALLARSAKREGY